MESKQLARNSQAARSTTVTPEKFSGIGNDTDFQAFLDQFEVYAKMNKWNEEEKANIKLILCMKEQARVVMSQLSSEDKNSYERMVKALRNASGP